MSALRFRLKLDRFVLLNETVDHGFLFFFI